MLDLRRTKGHLLSSCEFLNDKFWGIFVLDGLLHPHNSTPYVQTGISIAL
jgi:hypothetical protein